MKELAKTNKENMTITLYPDLWVIKKWLWSRCRNARPYCMGKSFNEKNLVQR